MFVVNLFFQIFSNDYGFVFKSPCFFFNVAISVNTGYRQGFVYISSEYKLSIPSHQYMIGVGRGIHSRLII